MKSKKALLYGVGSYKNRGCEALVASSIRIFDKYYDKISIASYDIDYNRDFYCSSSHKYVNHYITEEEMTGTDKEKYDYYKTLPFDYNNFELLSQKEVVEEMEDADVCVSIGGDNYSYGDSNWLYAIATEAKKRGIFSILWGASLYDEITNMELVENLKNFDILLLRESISYNAIKPYIDDSKLLLAPDPAFSLKPQKIELDQWYKKRHVIGLNLSPLTIKNEKQYRAILDFIHYVLEYTDYSISLIPHVLLDISNDMEILKNIYNKFENNDRIRLENTENLNYQQIKYIISKLDFMIAARTHASISAYSSCIPTIVIGYSVKSKGIAKDLFGDYEKYVIANENLTFSKLKDSFQYIEKNALTLKKELKKKMEIYISQIDNMFEQVQSRFLENTKKKICDKQLCVGCGVCQNICPAGAITMEEDNEGYLFPKLDLKKCTYCNLCRNSCPILNKQLEPEYQKKCYAAKNKNLDVVEKSSSGGIFTILAYWILQKNGTVYGSFYENGRAVHIGVRKVEDLEKIRGSKYIQSSIIDVFPLIKRDLKEGKKVLFCGTPCQIGAIKSVIGKTNENLICVSVVCHGVMNSKILTKYFKDLKIDSSDSFKFREKTDSGKSAVSYYVNDNKRVVEFMNDPLMWLYVKNYLLRESCYHCQYKGEHNLADIILGDYWGIEKYHSNQFDGSASMVVSNTLKGEQYLRKCGFFDKTRWLESDIDNAKEDNSMFFESPKRPFERTRVLKQLESNHISMVQNNLFLQEQVKQLQQLNSQLNNQDYINGLREELQLRYDELEAIYHSRRWIIPTKIIDFVQRRKK